MKILEIVELVGAVLGTVLGFFAGRKSKKK